MIGTTDPLYYVYCDFDGCSETTDDHETISIAKSEALECGWTLRDGKWYCELHSSAKGANDGNV